MNNLVFLNRNNESYVGMDGFKEEEMCKVGDRIEVEIIVSTGQLLPTIVTGELTSISIRGDKIQIDRIDIHHTQVISIKKIRDKNEIIIMDTKEGYEIVYNNKIFMLSDNVRVEYKNKKYSGTVKGIICQIKQISNYNYIITISVDSLINIYIYSENIINIERI